jgi:adenylate kinase
MYDQKQIDTIKQWLGSSSINIFGLPFAGKDSQGKRLAELFGGNLVSGGEILRGNEMPDNIKQNMRTGKLTPSNDYANIVLSFMDQPHLAGHPLFLSAVGRWHGEEEAVIKALEKSNHPLKVVIYLNMSDTDSSSRWLMCKNLKDRENRIDDTEEILKVRFAEFEEKTLPVIDYYHNLGMLIEIDGRLSRDEVTRNIIEAIYQRIST